MLSDAILITQLNDFIFCPVSIYFHNLYGGMERHLFQAKDQINGTAAHMTVDQGRYSTRKDIMMGIPVYSERYNLVGKIDIFDEKHKRLTERKKRISTVYDGYIFQLYGQYYAMSEMGYDVKSLHLYSIDTNSVFKVKRPEDDPVMDMKFKKTIQQIIEFDVGSFVQPNPDKCRRCIYEPACDRGLK